MGHFHPILKEIGVDGDFMLVSLDGFNLVALHGAQGSIPNPGRQFDVHEVTQKQVFKIASDYVSSHLSGRLAPEISGVMSRLIAGSRARLFLH